LWGTAIIACAEPVHVPRPAIRGMNRCRKIEQNPHGAGAVPHATEYAVKSSQGRVRLRSCPAQQSAEIVKELLMKRFCATLVSLFVALLAATALAAPADFSAEQKMAIVLEGLQSTDDGAAVCARHSVPQKAYQQWREQFFAAQQVLLASANNVYAQHDPVRSSAVRETRPQPSAMVAPTPASDVKDMRLEVALGAAYGGGSASGTSRKHSWGGGKSAGNWDIDNVGTGLGLAAGMQIWKDRLFGHELLSAGLEYEYNHYFSKISSPEGSARGELHLNSALANIALRKPFGELTPYAGLGLGAVFYDAWAKDGTGDFMNAGEKSSHSGVAPMIQAFAGADYALNDSIYTGLEVKFGYFNASVFGADVSYHKMDTLLKLGTKF